MSNEIQTTNTTHFAALNENGVVLVTKDVSIELGTPQETGRWTFIRNTYPARYNHVVKNMNRLNGQLNIPKRMNMRGGHFLLYRFIILIAIVLTVIFGIVSVYVKAASIVSFTIVTIYLLVSICNVVIFFKNRPLLNPDLTVAVPQSNLGKMQNTFYSVPINATVTTGAVAAYFDTAVINAMVQKYNVQLTEVTLMVYGAQYLRNTRPFEIIVHGGIFFVLFILSIIFVTR